MNIAEKSHMKRIIDHHLRTWKISQFRKPLLLRGARQVGKTHAVRELGRSFENCVEINLEELSDAKIIFDVDLDPVRMIRDLALLTGQRIEPGKTLLFFDEVQAVPRALTALRYFYEKMPSLHLIAAGSLLDFTIQEVGIPVGRVSSLYLYPMSFLEFLVATGNEMLASAVLNNITYEPFSEPIHKKLLRLIAQYCAIGGMPEVVDRWCVTQDPQLCFEVHHTLLDTYRQDFSKYAAKYQIKYLDALFSAVPRQLGRKFKYSAVAGEFRKRELAPSLDLLITAGAVLPVTRSAGNGVPLGAEVDPEDFKMLFLDIALAQAMLGLDLRGWFLDAEQEFVNKGALMEAFVGQELLAYADSTARAQLFYWARHTPGSEAEVDYLVQDKAIVVPIEVKAGAGTTLKSMRAFLDGHPQSLRGLRFSTQNYSVYEKICSLPLYAVVQAIYREQGTSFAELVA